MKNIRIALQTRLNSGTAKLVDCAKITTVSGVTYYMADFPVDILIGSNLYLSTYGYRASATNANAALSPDTIDIQFLLGAGVAKQDILGGLFDGAQIRTFTTDFDDPLEDDIKNTRGFFGKAVLYDNIIVTEYASLLSRMDQQVGEQTTPKCRAEVGDSKCRVKMDPPFWTATSVMTQLQTGGAEIGSVVKPSIENKFYYSANIVVDPGETGLVEPTWPLGAGATVVDNDVTWTAFPAHIQSFDVLTITDKRNFTLNITDSDGVWDYGVITCLDGENAGFRKEIKLQVGESVELFEALPYDFTIGDKVQITRGCRKRLTEDCISLYNNIFNYRGEPFTPTKAEVFRFGGQ